MIALPGPSVLLTVAHCISFGSRSALAIVAGATVGIAVQLMVAAIDACSKHKKIGSSDELHLPKTFGKTYSMKISAFQSPVSDFEPYRIVDAQIDQTLKRLTKLDVGQTCSLTPCLFIIDYWGNKSS